MSNLTKNPAAPRARVNSGPSGPSDTLPAGTTPAQWCVGIVQRRKNGDLQVRSGALVARAKRAVSCLLEPENGDSVACLRVAPNEIWIVAVLEREEGVANVLRCTGNTRLQVLEGALQFDASALRLDSEKLHIAAKHTHVASETIEVVGRQLQLVATVMKVVGSALSTVMDRVNHFSKHHLRTTDGIDRVSATHIECEAKQLMRLDAEHTLVTGTQLVKARGAQIHFG
jgi:hypothetical protein